MIKNTVVGCLQKSKKSLFFIPQNGQNVGEKFSTAGSLWLNKEAAKQSQLTLGASEMRPKYPQKVSKMGPEKGSKRVAYLGPFCGQKAPK